MTSPLPSRIPLGVALGLSLASLACAVEPQTCDGLRDQVTIEEVVAPGLSAASALASFADAPQPTLTWLDPPILDDGWGASEISVDHVGECSTPLDVEVLPRGDESTWVEPEGDGACGAAGLLIPVHVRITSEDGALALEADAGLTGTDVDDLALTLVLDAAPASLGLQIGPPDPERVHDFVVHVRLVDGQISGELRVHSHDCTPEADCTYWAEHVVGQF